MSPKVARKSGKRFVRFKRRVFFTAIKLRLDAAADADTPGRWTARPKRWRRRLR